MSQAGVDNVDRISRTGYGLCGSGLVYFALFGGPGHLALVPARELADYFRVLARLAEIPPRRIQGRPPRGESVSRFFESE
jgi:hypothetical protein